MELKPFSSEEETSQIQVPHKVIAPDPTESRMAKDS